MGVFSQIFIYSLYNDTERTCSNFKLYFQDFTILSQLPPTPTTAISNLQSLFLITTTKRLASFNLARFLNWGKMNSKLTYKPAQAYSILQTKTGNEVLQTFSKESWLGFVKASVTCSSIWSLEKQGQDSSVMKFHNHRGEILCRRHSPHFIRLWLPSNGLPHHCEAETF